MNTKKLLKYSCAHFLLSLVFWFLALTIALGTGFNDDSFVLDRFFSILVTVVMKILTFPVWWIVMNDLPSWTDYLLIPIQVMTSIAQSFILLWIVGFFKRH